MFFVISAFSLVTLIFFTDIKQNKLCIFTNPQKLRVAFYRNAFINIEINFSFVIMYFIISTIRCICMFPHSREALY